MLSAITVPTTVTMIPITIFGIQFLTRAHSAEDTHGKSSRPRRRNLDASGVMDIGWREARGARRRAMDQVLVEAAVRGASWSSTALHGSAVSWRSGPSTVRPKGLASPRAKWVDSILIGSRGAAQTTQINNHPGQQGERARDKNGRRNVRY
jgi:hypothetical protein